MFHKKNSLAIAYAMAISSMPWDDFNLNIKNQQNNKQKRPCLNCGTLHQHNNSFCSATCCKKWSNKKS